MLPRVFERKHVPSVSRDMLPHKTGKHGTGRRLHSETGGEGIGGTPLDASPKGRNGPWLESVAGDGDGVGEGDVDGFVAVAAAGGLGFVILTTWPMKRGTSGFRGHNTYLLTRVWPGSRLAAWHESHEWCFRASRIT